ncbi:uncharacterized protein RCO7_08415 [Rhynchosporium graminicola]|uniref:Aminoglycoside phosphotransferase domain-containing protein n=1 Tax=Rhynchosporium graminicola TaxID=2792576 RepID=A0A1E1LT68_9HELO|nr:uncharacterized protein RCO7_08415 [Rhynchosporium commune]
MDLAVEDIPEAEVFRYTRHRWVIQPLAKVSQIRSQELVRVAVKATSANRCTEVLKCKESMNNKAFLLTMDNGSVVFAKLPHACAGPAYYTTASEVATRTFLREVLDIPNPPIIAWCSQKSNPVGAEYILEERVEGQPLSSLWQDWKKLSSEDRFSIIRQVVQMERKLTDASFKQCGCIYFKEDFPHGSHITMAGRESASTLERFRMGPLVTEDQWQGQKTSMDLNRGPFQGALDFIRQRAINEKYYIEQHAKPRLNYARSTTELEQPEEMLGLIDKYLKLTSAMLPPPTPDHIDASTLWHPDLHLDNLFIDPSTLKITSFIDWQSTLPTPLYYQCGVPKMVCHRVKVSLDLSTFPKLPDNFNDLDEDEKEYAQNMHRSEHLHQYYLRITKRDNPRHWTALQLHDDVRIQPVRIVQQVWDDNTVFFLRRALLRIIAKWESLCPDAGPCPVSPEEDASAFDSEIENREFVSDVLNLMQKNYRLHPDGTVLPGKYDEVQTELERLRAVGLEAAEDEEERLCIEKLWPYQDSVDKAAT